MFSSNPACFFFNSLNAVQYINHVSFSWSSIISTSWNVSCLVVDDDDDDDDVCCRSDGSPDDDDDTWLFAAAAAARDDDDDNDTRRMQNCIRLKKFNIATSSFRIRIYRIARISSAHSLRF